MKIRRHLTYANVGVTICLFLVIAGATAYATGTIGSRQIANDSIRSIDLKNRKAVRGKDVANDSLRGGQIAERTLNAAAFAPLAGNTAPACSLGTTFTDCVTTTIRLAERSRILVIATGGEVSTGAPTHVGCAIRIDGQLESNFTNPGEEMTDNTSPDAQNGFARTLVSDGRTAGAGGWPAGRHTVAMACKKGVGTAEIDSATIAVLGIGSRSG